MGAGGWAMAAVLGTVVLTLAFLVASMARAIAVERRPGRSVWRDFGLGLVLMILFLVTWVAHLVAEWQVYTDDQLDHGATPAIGDFVATFAQSTLENWQSEFLQLFSFVVLAALYVHRGSAESKDGEERIEAALRRIEERLATLPPDAPGPEQPGTLPDAP